MSLDGDDVSVPPTLTPPQHKLFISEPRIPYRAIDAVCEALGAEVPAASLDAMLMIAVRGTVEAAVTYDSQRGVEYKPWALYYAILRLLEWMRGTHGEDKELLARIRRAMLQFMAHESQPADPWKVTRESCVRSLSGFADSVVMSGVVAWGRTSVLATRGEEGVTALEAAARAGDALRQVVRSLRPEQRLLIQHCHVYGARLTLAARAQRKNYFAVVREYHDILALMAARLRGLGIRAMPAWLPEVSGQVFDDPVTPANDDGGTDPCPGAR